MIDKRRLTFSILIFSIIIPLILGYPQYRLNNFFFFDPVTNNPCNENNYWTPFDQSTTCYRFVSITTDDTKEKSSISIMLDHNVGVSNFTNYKNALKKMTKNWVRYKGTVNIIDEKKISKLMKYKSIPKKTSFVAPPYKVGHYCSNSNYIIKGKNVNERGYWTKTSLNVNLIYAIDENGKNILTPPSRELGIRPVLEIKKSLLVADTGVIDISSIIKKGEVIKYKHENILYDGLIYKQLQGFTVTKDKLVYMSSNNNNRPKSVLYSYKLNNLNNLFKKEYGTTGHGNGMTYNSKANKVLVIGPYEYTKVYMYNGDTLVKEKEYPKEAYPQYTSIGYDYNDDLYVGQFSKQLFLADSKSMKKLYEFGIQMFEAGQDLEYYNGYTYFCTTDLSAPSKYQTYSFYKKLDNIIYVYDMNLDKNKNPTKNFGRLVQRLFVRGLGELEGMSFRGGYVYFGFAHSPLSYSYVFYKVEYKQFEKEIKKILSKNKN